MLKQNATSGDALSSAEKTDLLSLKSHADKLNVDQLKTISDDLSNLKSNEGKSDNVKLTPVLVDLNKSSNVVKNNVVKKDAYNAKMKNIEEKIPDTTKLASTTTLNAKRNEVKGEIPSIINLATTTPLIAVEHKIPDTQFS